jgi:hypothetical protein
MISTLNSSGSVPLNTVLAVPRMPSLSSLIGKKAVVVPDVAADPATWLMALPVQAIIRVRTNNAMVDLGKNIFLLSEFYGNILPVIPEAFSIASKLRLDLNPFSCINSFQT